MFVSFGMSNYSVRNNVQPKSMNFGALIKRIPLNAADIKKIISDFGQVPDDQKVNMMSKIAVNIFGKQENIIGADDIRVLAGHIPAQVDTAKYISELYRLVKYAGLQQDIQLGEDIAKAIKPFKENNTYISHVVQFSKENFRPNHGKYGQYEGNGASPLSSEQACYGSGLPFKNKI